MFEFITTSRLSSIQNRLFSTEVELDLSKELRELFFGDDFGLNKGVIVKHKSFRTDNSKKVKCSCNTRNIDTGLENCPYCFGDGYLFDEKFIEVFLSGNKRTNFFKDNEYRIKSNRSDTDLLYVAYENKYKIKEMDKIFTLTKDNSGEILLPISTNTEYLAVDVQDRGFDYNGISYRIASLSLGDN